MKNTPTDPVPLLQDLIRCRSVTPAEGGALTYLENLLSTHGFVCHRLIFRQEGTPDVENLFARIGSSAPHLCFAGHTDVVPEGLLDGWTHSPFAGEIADGFVFGRGACDMKGSVAAFTAEGCECPDDGVEDIFVEADLDILGKKGATDADQETECNQFFHDEGSC